VDELTAKQSLARVAHKMPIPCRFVSRRHQIG
jgi:ribosomal protein L16/L10AE